jgi:hypothetical protein
MNMRGLNRRGERPRSPALRIAKCKPAFQRGWQPKADGGLPFWICLRRGNVATRNADCEAPLPLIPLHWRGKYCPLEMGNIRGGVPYRFCRRGSVAARNKDCEAPLFPANSHLPSCCFALKDFKRRLTSFIRFRPP